MALELDIHSDVDAAGRVVVHGVARIDGGLAELPDGFWPVVIVNCPEMVPDGDSFRRDRQEAIRLTVLDAVQRALGA